MFGRLDDRTVRILTGLIATVFLLGAAVFGVKAATGGLTPVYHLQAEFAAAGQGLIRDSDVKIHGVNIGRVTKVRLHDGRALVTMEIHDGERIPRDAKATIRPKTLFGEKFVDIDPGDRETTGPFLGDGDRITNTLGGFELERVLAEAYPILQAIDPAELAVVVDTLAGGARGQGELINRQLANWAKVAAVSAEHNADTQQFLDDLARLSGELANRAPDVLAGARDLNDALPALNQRGDELADVLESASTLSADLADVLEKNRSFLEKNVTEGGKTLDIAYAERDKLPGLVSGLRKFFQVLGEAARGIPLPDGTHLAPVKLVFGGGSPCGRTTVGCPVAPLTTQPPPPPAPATQPGAPAPAVPQLPVPTAGVEGLLQLIGGVL